MPETSIQETIQASFRVDPQLCIACDACCQDFPEVFYMGGDQKAHARDDQKADLYNARTVVDVCPTAAILYSGELPPAEDLSKLEEVPGWELEWARWRGVEEDQVERNRRYGRDYEVTEQPGYLHVRFRFPTRVPAVRDRFRYGMPEEMPLYRNHIALEGNRLLIAGWVADPKIRALTHTSSSFPGQFMTTLEFQREVVGFAQRFDAHAQLEVVVFTDPAVQANWTWKAHFITDKCTACTICERVCPTNAITGGERFYIDPDLCINCSVCGVYCPFDAINDNKEKVVEKIKVKQIPKAVVHEELCTGCEFCVDICPFDALKMELCDDGFNRIAVVIENNCVSCKLCEQVCIKDAIEVPRKHQFEDIGMSFMSYLSDEH
jgi:electron transport complex protein RnfB